MKRLFLLFISLTICFVVFSQTLGTSDVESFSISSITGAIKLFISYINWVYVLIFMLVTWLINDTADASNIATWLTWFGRIPKTIRTFMIGILLITLFMWTYKLTGRIEIFKMILSLILAMVIYKFGINKIFAWLSDRLGFKFE